MSEGSETPKTPDELLDEAVDERVGIYRTRELGLEALEKKASLSGLYDSDAKAMVSGAKALGNVSADLDWIDTLTEMGFPEDITVTAINIKDEFAHGRREVTGMNQEEQPSVIDSLRLRIRDQEDILRDSEIRLEVATEELRASGKLTPEAERLVKLSSDTSRARASLDLLMAMVEVKIPDIQAGLVQEIFDEKQRTVNETEAFVAKQARDETKD